MFPNYFQDCTTVEEIKALYKKLAMENHPDLGGDTATMQEINNQYQQALKKCQGQKSTDENGKEHTYKYNESVEVDLMRVISELLALKMDADVYLIGTWVWILGDTKPHKEQLKELKCRWHAQRAAWYYRDESNRGYGSSKGGLSDIADKYGCKKFSKDDDVKTKSKKRKKLA